MASFNGFGELRAPCDLVRKLKHDLERIEKSPEDQYAAFDFFVTAEHIIDWLYPDDKDEKVRKQLRLSSPLLRISSHLANGAKHFEARAKQHKSVEDIEKSRYVEAGYVEVGYIEDPLIVHLTPDEEISFGHGSIEVTSLARQVLAYWQTHAPQA